jgi:hypothetical protein
LPKSERRFTRFPPILAKRISLELNKIHNLLCFLSLAAVMQAQGRVSTASEKDAANARIPQANAIQTSTPSPVAFYDSDDTLLYDAGAFVWDDDNHRLGLGTTAPASALDIFGGNIKLNSGYTVGEAYNLSGRVGVGFPVPYFTPTTNNSIIAFDVYPKGTPSNFTYNTGVAWFDLCSTDVNSHTAGYECLRMGKFANGDGHVGVAKGGDGTVRNLDLQINGGNVGVGTTSPAALLAVGASSQFQVDTAGNIVKLNNVRTNFPSANAAGFLTNDGSGNFYYTKVSSAVAPSATYTGATLPASAEVGTTVKVSGGSSVSDCGSGSGTITRSCVWNGSGWQFSPTGGYVLSTEPGNIPANSISFAAPAMAGVSPTEALRQYVVPKACQVSRMYMNFAGEQAAAGSLAVTLRVAPGGVSPADSNVSAMLAAGAPATAIVSDTTHTVDLAAGDLLSVKIVNEGAAINLLSLSLYCAY